MTDFMWTLIIISLTVLFLAPVGAYLIARMATLGVLRAKSRYKELEQEEKSAG